MAVGAAAGQDPLAFVGMQLVPHHMQQLLAAAANAPGSEAERKGMSLPPPQSWHFEVLLKEIRTKGAGGLQRPQQAQAVSQMQAQQQQQQQQQYQQQAYQQQQQQQQAAMPTTAVVQPNPYAPRGRNNSQPQQQARCDLPRAQAVLDPLLQLAMQTAGPSADSLQRGVRELYDKMRDGRFDWTTAQHIATLVDALERRDFVTATKARDQIVRTTTTGWVQHGTWQYSMRQLITAAEQAR